MKLSLIAMIIVLFASTVAAQGIFVPWKGQREIIETKHRVNMVKKMSGSALPCGEYFLFREIRDQKILSFMIRLEKEDKIKNVVAYQHFDLGIMVYAIDRDKEIPTAEYLSTRGKNGRRGWLLILRMSKATFEAAKCLRHKRTPGR